MATRRGGRPNRGDGADALGHPLGSDGFLSKVEHALGRRVRALPIGRQKGWRKKGPDKPKESRGKRPNKR